jgi:uncharacterized membrane protein YecN with MAPEG domain
MPHLTALVTLLALAFYLTTVMRVGMARGRAGIKAPAMTGDPEFERTLRVQLNTLEWLPLMLPALWLFAFYVSDLWAAVLGLVWIVGRVMYLLGYTAAAEKRGPGFGIQFLATLILWVGALVAIVSALIKVQ